MLATTEILYPDSDGQPMADNTKQFRWISVIKNNLDWLFQDEELVFVAGDLLWYPVEGNPKYRMAPDVMVVFGRPKGDSPGATLCERGSYKQWQEADIVPQVVFEILFPGNTEGEMERKLQIYARCGVEEYYVYDPDNYVLKGYQREDDFYLARIDLMDGWTSPRLGINFQLGEGELQLTHPDGRLFETFESVATERDTILAEKQQLEIDKNKRDAKLRELGIDPDTL